MGIEASTSDERAGPVFARHLRRLLLLLLLWPASLGRGYLQMILVGIAIGIGLPGMVPWLEPIGVLGLQASQLVVMPLLACELLLALGSLAPGSLPGLLRRGGIGLLLLWLMGGLAVLLMPLMLPQLRGSPLFDPALLSTDRGFDLVRTVVPSNLFQALATDNVAAVVTICAVLGVLLHRLEDRDELLRPLAVLTRLFRELNRFVMKVLPFSVVALTARSVSKLDLDLLLRLQGLIGITFLAAVVVVVLLIGTVHALVPCRPRELVQIAAGPLGLVLGSASLVVALPLLLENLRRVLGRHAWGSADDRLHADEAMTAVVAIGLALPGLGQVMGLVCLPFLAWMRDHPLPLIDQLKLLAIGIPSAAGGLKTALREGLRLEGLPLDLLTIIDISGTWIYRFEKGLTLVGLIVLALVVYCGALGRLRFRPLPLLVGAAFAGLLSLLVGGALHAGLAAGLQGRYRNDQLVLSREALAAQPPVQAVVLPPPGPVSLQALRERRRLRLGVRREGMPWAYRNSAGHWVGFDLDLVRALARDLGIVQIDLVEGTLPELEAWLSQGRLDLVAGGVAATPGRSARFTVSESYFKAHIGLVVADEAVQRIQQLDRRPLDRPLRLAVIDPQLLSPLLRERIDGALGGDGPSVRFEAIPNRAAFFSGAGRQRFDGLLTSTEGGAAWSAVHPDTTVLAPFGPDLPLSLALLIGGSDPDLEAYINSWIANADAQGVLRQFYRHWILMESTAR
jgi:Na+/H+-dicarboxylate symporter/ABC-type amino acid transport substrate-binding protein